jgi:hypothetical protein
LFAPVPYIVEALEALEADDGRAHVAEMAAAQFQPERLSAPRLHIDVQHLAGEFVPAIGEPLMFGDCAGIELHARQALQVCRTKQTRLGL